MEHVAAFTHRLMVILLGEEGRRPISPGRAGRMGHNRNHVSWLRTHSNCSPCLLLKTIESSPILFSIQSGQVVVNRNIETLLQSCIKLLSGPHCGDGVRRVQRTSVFRKVCPIMVKLRLEVNKEEGTIIFHNVPAILDSQKKDFVKAIFLHLPDGTYLLRCGKEHRRMISDTRITEPCLVSLRFKVNSSLKLTCTPLKISCLQQVKEKTVVREAVKIFPTRLADNPNHTIFSLLRILAATDHDISEEDLACLCTPTFRSQHVYGPMPTPLLCANSKKSYISLPVVKSAQYWESLIGLCENVDYPNCDPCCSEKVPVTRPFNPLAQVKSKKTAQISSISFFRFNRPVVTALW